MNKEIVLATNNLHKLKEFREVLSPLGYVVYSPKDLNIKNNPKEDGKDYFQNSYIKAKSLANLVPFPVIADDSGLEIKILNDFPGIYSARFANEFGDDYIKAGSELNNRIGTSNFRDAEFHCVICFLDNKLTKPLYFEGICKGKFLKDPLGSNGFGYDPFFFSTELNKAFGLLTDEEKNKVSHRGKAIKKLVTYLSIK